MLLWSPPSAKDSSDQPWYSKPQVAFSPNGRWLAAGFVDGSVQLWDVTASRMVRAKVHDDAVQGVSFNEDSRWLLTEDSKGRGCLWQASLEPKNAGQLCQDGVKGIQISGKAPWLIAPAGAKVRLWSVKNGDSWAEPLVIDTGLKEVSGVLMDPEARWLVAYHNFDSIVLWRRRRPSPTAVIRLDPPRHLQSIRLSPDGRWLAAGGGWGDVAFWDLLPPVTRRMSFSFEKVDLQQWGNLLSLYNLGPGRAIAAVWWRADGWKEIVGFVNPSSFVTDKTRVWVDLQEGALASYSALSPGLDISSGSQKMISENGRWLVSLETQTAALWHLRGQELERLTCDAAGRNLTDEEWKKYFPDQDYRKTCEDR
jgi:WD40 repeat protein